MQEENIREQARLCRVTQTQYERDKATGMCKRDAMGVFGPFPELLTART